MEDLDDLFNDQMNGQLGDQLSDQLNDQLNDQINQQLNIPAASSLPPGLAERLEERRASGCCQYACSLNPRLI